MKSVVLVLAACAIGLSMVACSGEEKPTQGDAEITKNMEPNTDPPAKARREQLDAGPQKPPVDRGR